MIVNNVSVIKVSSKGGLINCNKAALGTTGFSFLINPIKSV